MPAAYPEEFRRRAVDLVRASDESLSAVARRLGISVSGLRRWVSQAEIDEGRAPGMSTEERQELTNPTRGSDPPTTCVQTVSTLPYSIPLRASCDSRILLTHKSNQEALTHPNNLSTTSVGRTPSERCVADARLTDTIRRVFERSRGTYGSPRIWAELRHGLGIRVGRKRVERLMLLAGIAGVTRRKTTYRRRRRVGEVSADLVDRQFSPTEPDRLWLADITQHPTRGGIVYLAVVMDAWNREVIGWSIANHIRAQIVCDAFEMARWRRRPRPLEPGQYTCWAFGKKLRQAGILKSMGSVGDAYDNAAVESFFATLQTELLDRQRWETRPQLAQAIFEYIEGWYNPERRHSHNNQQSPVNYRHQQELVA